MLNNNKALPRGPQFLTHHMIFDLTTEDFQRKKWFVADGHMTEMSPIITYARMVSHETVGISCTIGVSKVK